MPAFLDSNLFRYFLLPALSLVSGFVCLYIDPKKNNKTAVIVILVLAASAIATGASGYQDDQKNQTNQAAEKKVSDAQTTLLTQTEQSVQYLVVLLQSSKSGALAAAQPSQINHTLVQQSLAASVALNQQSPAEAPATAKPQIQYFSKDIDKNVVTQALQEAGFRFAEKPAKLADQPTNAIWVGDPVSISDLKVLALTLVRAGIQIRAIQRFRQDSPRRSQLVMQVGTDAKMVNAAVWTVDGIQALTELPARDAGPGLAD